MGLGKGDELGCADRCEIGRVREQDEPGALDAKGSRGLGGAFETVLGDLVVEGAAVDFE